MEMTIFLGNLFHRYEFTTSSPDYDVREVCDCTLLSKSWTSQFHQEDDFVSKSLGGEGRDPLIVC